MAPRANWKGYLRKVELAAATALWSCPLLTAGANAQSTACFEIVAPFPWSELLLVMYDKCTGKSWMLVRTPVTDSRGNPTRNFTFHWKPISGDEGPALSRPNPTPP